MPSRLCALSATDTVELEHVRSFFRQYAAWLGVDLSFQGFADEIANLPGAYGAADGRLFYAEVDGKPVGSGKPGPVAVRLREIYLDEMRKAAI